MGNKAAIALAALASGMSGFANMRKQQRQDDLEERKLAAQEAALSQKEPSSGIAAVKFFENKFNRPLKEEEAMGLLSPAGLPSAEYKAFLENPQKFKDFQEIKSNRPKLDLGGGDRPAIRAPQSDAPPPTPGFSSEQRDEGSAGQPTAQTGGGKKIKLRINPDTGALEEVNQSQAINFEDL